MKMRLWKIIFAVLFLLPVWAQAVPITIQISGNVTSASGSALPDTIYEGVTFTGTYTYDSSTLDSGGGVYQFSSPYGFNISVGGFEFKTTPSHVDQFVISILDNYAPYGNIHDDYWVQSYENSSLSSGALIDSISWKLFDGSHTALSSSALPVAAPILSQWNVNNLEICGPGTSLSIQGTVTQAVLIPEPATSTFLLIINVFLLRRRR